MLLYKIYFRTGECIGKVEARNAREALENAKSVFDSLVWYVVASNEHLNWD